MRLQVSGYLILALFSSMIAGAAAASPWLAQAGASRAYTADSGGSLVEEAKIKCRLTESGKLICENVKKNKGGNKCAGKNNCGPGFRDLESPNKYGACCEAVPTNSCNQGCKNHCTNSFVPGSQKWKSCVAGCGC